MEQDKDEDGEEDKEIARQMFEAQTMINYLIGF